MYYVKLRIYINMSCGPERRMLRHSFFYTDQKKKIKYYQLEQLRKIFPSANL